MDAINAATEFITRSILPWGEIPTFFIEDGVEQNYIYMPMATAYYLDSSGNRSKKDRQCGDFLQKTWNSQDKTFQKCRLHPEIDTVIKLQYLYYNRHTDKLSHSYSDVDFNELVTEVNFVNDIAIELNYIQLSSIANKEKFHEYIKNLDTDKFLRNRTLFYSSKFFHFYQLAKICSENSIRLIDLGLRDSHIKIHSFDSTSDMVFLTYFMLIMKSPVDDIHENIRKIINLQEPDGSWAAESFFINSIGSKVLTSVFCVELLKKYVEWI